jgi:hypothetical protein
VLRDDQRMLGLILHAPRGPFYSPKAARSSWKQSGKAILAFVGWRTGQSGAPPDRHYSVSGADCFPKLAQPTVEDLEPLMHRTVRCPLLTVGSATRHARIALPTVGSADRWLTGQSGVLPDSPVNFSRTPPTISREQPVDETPA